MTTRRQAAAIAWVRTNITKAEPNDPDYTDADMLQWYRNNIASFVAGAEAEAAAGVECWVVEVYENGKPFWNHLFYTLEPAEKCARECSFEGTSGFKWTTKLRLGRLVLSEEGEK